MKRIRVFLFSGTGMTRYAVNILKGELEKQQVCCDSNAIESVRPQSISFENCDAVGIAYPVHSFNAPKIVADFAKCLPRASGLDIFIISTAGGFTRLNFASSRLLIKILNKKGYNVFSDRQFIKPSNFIIKDDEKTVRDKLEKVNVEMTAAAREIKNRTPYKMQYGFAVRIAAFIGRGEWFGAKWMGLFYYADKNCVRCGICVAGCPNRNIIVGGNRVRFKRKCGLCMRCFYICPERSLKIQRPFRFLRFDEWYDEYTIKVRRYL